MTVTNYKDPDGKALICQLYFAGFPMHRIGALFDVNQGRIADAVKPFKDAFDLPAVRPKEE